MKKMEDKRSSNNIIDIKGKTVTNGICKEIDERLMKWSQNITVINLSNKNIVSLDEKICFPQNLVELIFSHNKLVSVPNAIMKLNSLKILDLSYNCICRFDDTPNFCQTIESLNISNNKLNSPPYWIWNECPINLAHLNLNYNFDLTESLKNGRYEVFLMHTTPVINLEMYTCYLKEYKGLIGTFQKVKVLMLGDRDIRGFSNYFEDIPFKGLDKCCDIERLNVSNTKVYNIRPSIDIFKNLMEINLSQNCITNLPKEFCNLVNLEVCMLSHNSLIYLPDEITKLKKLTHLYLDFNSLCMLPDNISELANLRTLDIYDNNIYEIPDQVKDLLIIDLAQNYFDEPDDTDYLEKRAKLRFDRTERIDGRKIEAVQPESESSCSLDISSDDSLEEKELQNVILDQSSDEDWDSDDYWVPNSTDYIAPPQSSWNSYVKKKVADGNFCPVDLHTASVADEVKYEKSCNPPVVYESDGQFDDLSDDDS